ncbi:MAG: PepSY-associated TM helix domain-containing protein [Candidatus Krumholzibacteriia bacterium]
MCRWLHRELGFLAVGLTLAYAVSGVAVNHVDSWNPSYILATETSWIDPVGLGSTEDVTAAVLAQLDPGAPVKNVWRATPEQLRIIVENATWHVRLDTGEVVWEGFRDRPLLRDLNFLHLNHGKGIWTWIADGYAVVLLILALTGIFLVRGRRGLAGRGGALMAAGFLLPIVYLVLVR